MEPTDEGFILSSGKKFYANQHVIGLCTTEIDGICIAEGSDGCVFYDGYEDDNDWTNEDLTEIALYMIKKWTEALLKISKRNNQ